MRRDETIRDGLVVEATEIDLDAGTIRHERDGVTVDGPRPLTLEERRMYGPQPLDGLPLIAALNAAVGIWSLSDAANIAGVSEQTLVYEVTAWSVAQEMNEEQHDS